MIVPPANSANKAKENKRSEDKKAEEPEDDEDGDVVHSEVTVKPKQALAATANKKEKDGKNPPLAPKPKGKGKSGNCNNPPTTPKPKKQEKKEKSMGKKAAKKPDGDVYVNVSARSVENDNLYMNVEKSANSETQKPSENVGPDGTIYADLSFARSAPAAVKQHEDGDEDDDDKVVYASINFAKKTPTMEKK